MKIEILEAIPRSPGVWALAWRRLKTDRVGMLALGTTAMFILMVLATQLGLLANNWQAEVGVPNAPPHFVGKNLAATGSTALDAAKGPNVDLSIIDPLAPRYPEWDKKSTLLFTPDTVKQETLPFGGDRLGRDILAKAVKGAQVSIAVGLLAALLATLVGTLLGAVAGYFGGLADDFLEWLYNVFTAVPYILLVFAMAAVIKSGPLASTLGNGIWTVVIILSVVGWTSIYRMVRAEYMKHRAREYVRAAESIGASHMSRMFTHILPNIGHVVLVQLSLLVVSFIKSEVILSFLGLGVPVDMVSWGTMLSEAQTDLIQGYWWQIMAATVFMAIFVTAFALLTDALRDALDPKLR
jgi:peptide/nickel transport system permease protein